MKPLKLTMSAFGSYAKEEVLDFTKLGEKGLYLITGETGAGKTTIFDAISYALFGKASGSARNNYKMLRSDFAKQNVKTKVELDFLSGGNLYNIRREIIPHASRKTEDVKYTEDVSMTLPDGTILNTKKDLEEKIYDLIGLDRDQFAQIVMIAQNDFLRFLQSGTDDRVKILRRIFGTEALKRFQDNLKTLTKEKDDERKSLLRDFEKHDVDPYGRDAVFTKWEQEIKNDEAAIKEADEELGGHEKKRETLTRQIAVAEGLNKSFSDLAAQSQALDAHNAKKEEMEAAARKKQRGETALRKVKPFADKAGEAEKAYKASSADFEKAKTVEQEAALAVDRAKKILLELPLLESAQTAFENLRREWDQCAPKLEKLSAIKNDYDIITEKQNKLDEDQKEFENLMTKHKSAKAQYDCLYEQFLRGQAGVLAQSLKSGEKCPVCGSTEHPAPAAAPEQDISENKLKELRTESDKSKEKLDAKSKECSSLQADIDARKDRFLKDFNEFSKTGVWDETGNELSAVFLETKTRLDELTIKKNSDEAAIAELKKNHEDAARKHSESEKTLFSARTLAAERENREKEQQTLCDTANGAFKNALATNDFADETSYAGALITEETLIEITQMLAAYEENGSLLRRDIARLESETEGKDPPDLEKLNTEAAQIKDAGEALRSIREEKKSQMDNTARILKELKKSGKNLGKIEKELAALKGLSDIANGKLDFETYAQMTYFEHVLRAANTRLKVMSQNRYTLLRKEEIGDGRKRMGLEIEVADNYTGKNRSANSLSGGESFMASLSLALGLSDVVQQSAGGIRLDAMFIDEGFGSLDAEVLELAIRTLSDMAGGNRIIGIISHVAELRERIDKQVRVEKTTLGSKISLLV